MNIKTYNVKFPVRKDRLVTEITRAISMSEINATIIKIPGSIIDINGREKEIKNICDKYKGGRNMAKNNNGKNTIQEIPKLPHGQGSISWIPERNKFLYKKNVHGHRKSVLGDTVKEVMAEMNRMTWSKKPQYQYGFCLCANIFLGLRAGEMLALKWKDIDFIDGTVYVHENLQMASNPLGSPAQVYETQSLKNYQNRTVRMNSNAKHFLELQKKYSGFTAPDNYVCCTRDGKHATVSYLSNNINEIEKAAGTKVKSYGTHIIRHTCASLYFKKGVRTELIAALLGHSVEVCRKTYIHFEEEQKKEAVKLLDDYEINYRFW